MLCSVIIPNYNDGKSVVKAIDSVYSANREIVVIDDCSDDDSLKIIEKMATESRRINEMFEPQKGVENKRALKDLYSQSPTMLRRQGSNLRQIDYTYPKISLRGGLYHYPFEYFKLGYEALPIYLKKINSTP